jgi:hypothetical protein
MKNFLLCLSILFILVHPTFCQNAIGVFEQISDIGNVKTKGTTTFANGVYTISGSGANIWFEKDELHYASNNMKGDFMLYTEPSFLGIGTDPHRKIGWMIRTNNNTSAAMVCLTVHGDGLVAFQFRKKEGANVEEIKIPMKYAEALQVERRGRSFFVSVAKLGEPFWSVEVPDFDFPTELNAGIFICSHNADVVEKAEYRNTRIFSAVKPK